MTTSQRIQAFLKNSIPKNIKKQDIDLYHQIFADTTFLPDSTRLGERIYCILNNIKQRKLCTVCNTPVKFQGKVLGYRQFCSTFCSNSNEGVIDKKKSTNRERFGVDFPAQSAEIREQMQSSTFAKYGVYHSQQSPEVLAKTKKTNEKKYGSDTFFKSENFKEKQRKTCLERYGVNSISQVHISEDVWQKINDPEWLERQNKQNGMKLIQIAESLGVSVSLISNYFQKFHITPYYYSGQSEAEKEIIEFLINQNVRVIEKDRNIAKPKEIDIVLPDFNLCIEFCGLYWHADIHERINHSYHLDKLNKCNEKGFDLITIFEDEWIEKKEIVKRFLLYKIGKTTTKIYARKCKIIDINSKQKSNFFNEYHIQGNGNGSITYALTYNNDVVAMMTFIKRKNGIYELNRYATSCNIVGGFSKLLSHFKKNNEWNKIISFADRRISNGNVYKKSGFELKNVSKPSYDLVIGMKRFHRRNFMKKHLPTKLQNFDPTLTEFQNCDNNNILRIWNCGQLKFEMSNEKIK